MSFQVELKKAIYSRLTNTLTEPVYDYVPENTQPPYIAYGDITCNEYDTDGILGFDATVTIHSWSGGSTYRGTGEAAGLMDKIYTVMHRAELTITGFLLINCDYENSNDTVEADGLTVHGLQRFRIRAQKT